MSVLWERSVTKLMRLSRQFNRVHLGRGRRAAPMFTCHEWMSSSSKRPEDEECDPPVKYTTSKAASWRARQSYGGISDDTPWFQPYVVSLSVAIFMLYFCVLRKESDIDEQLSKTLYSRIPGLEKKQLEISLQYNKDHGLDTADIEDRLAEIKSQSR